MCKQLQPSPRRRKLRAFHFDPTFREQSDRLIGSAVVGDQHVNVGDWAYQRRRDRAEFTGVGNDDNFLRLADHGAERERFFGFDHCHSTGGIDSAHAHKYFVHVNIAQKVDGGVADQGERSRPLHETAGHKRPQTIAVAQFHRNVYSIGNDANIVAISQGASDMSGGRTGGKSDGLVFLNQLGGGQPDASFVGDTMLFPVLKQRVVTERLVEEWLD